MKKIIHITKKTDWEKAKAAGVYTAPSLIIAGFIHCSLVHQITSVANFNYKGQLGLILLEINESKVKREVKYEDLENIGQLFPHIYGPLNTDAVLRTVDFPPESDGSFKLPKEILS
jgi:uncharacterized protein (DUF952 family)